MTIEECNAAAYRRLPVVHDEIVYLCIVEITRVFASDELIARGFPKTYYTVTLMDKNGRSFTRADPALVELVEVWREKELSNHGKK